MDEVQVLPSGGSSGGVSADEEGAAVAEVGGVRGWEASAFFSTLNLDRPGVLALTSKSCVEVGRGLATVGRKGVSSSRRASLMS